MKAVDVFNTIMNERIDAWVKLGVHVVGDRTPRWLAKQLNQPFVRHPTTLAEDRVINNMVVKAARELKRPYIVASQVKGAQLVNGKMVPEPTVLHLHIPKTKKLAPLVSWLLLVARERVDINANQRDLGCPVVVWARTGSRYRFDFHDHAYYDRWMDRCRNDIEFKRVLGTLPDEVTSA